MINTVGNGDSVLQPSYSQQDNLGCAEEAFLVNQTLDLNQFYYTEKTKFKPCAGKVLKHQKSSL